MKIFAKYFDENGEVYMFRPNEIYDSATNTFKPTDEKTFTVAMEKFSPLGNSHIWQRTFWQIRTVAVSVARKIAQINWVVWRFGNCSVNLA